MQNGSWLDVTPPAVIEGLEYTICEPLDDARRFSLLLPPEMPAATTAIGFTLTAIGRDAGKDRSITRPRSELHLPDRTGRRPWPCHWKT
jgi:hypothetical protein